MELTQHQELLIYFLEQQGLDKEVIIAISLMLAKSQDGIEAFIYLSHKEQLSTREDFLQLALDIAAVLPPEERTGEVFDPPIRIKVKH